MNREIFYVVTAQVRERGLNQRPLGGEPSKNGSPWSEPRKAVSPTHPFLRKGEAMFA